MRPLRWIPTTERGRCTVEITLRTVHRLFLLRPSRTLTRRIIGVLARAQARTDVDVHSFCFLSNHAHLLISVESTWQMAKFMAYAAGNVAREVCRLVDWSGKLWGRRYTHSLLTDEEACHVARFRYLAAQACAAGLTSSPLDWPGASAVPVLAAGKLEMRGEWVDRTALWKARRRHGHRTERDHTNDEVLRLAPLPGYEHLSRDDYAEWVRELVREIEVETAERHRQNGTAPLGIERCLAADPRTEPTMLDRSPVPLILFKGREQYLELLKALREVTAAFLDAADRLRRGILDVEFPENTFPPPRPMRFAAASGPDP